MLKYYCHNCAIATGRLTPANPMELTGTEYTLEKYIKHTAPSTTCSLNSVFTGPASESYKNYIVNALASGCVQIDNLGRTNVVWAASQNTGFIYSNGKFVSSAGAVKVVLHHNGSKIHPFPIQSTEVSGATCIACGKPVPC